MSDGCSAAASLPWEDYAPAPRLVVTVDTEEEGLWGGTYRVSGNTVENIQGVPRFQALCDRMGVRPTYLVDAPVVEDDRASDVLAESEAKGGCEIGTHVHPWCNPPIDEKLDYRESYLCNLPIKLQRAKIQWLTEAITQRFGNRPTSFRAGRYGLDIAGARILSELGYLVDSSVIPFMNYAPDGGPDFRAAPWRPYYAGGDDLCQSCEASALLEVPVSVGFNRRNFTRSSKLQDLLGQPPLRWLRLEGALDRSGILQRIKLSPEKATARQMKTLIDRYCEWPSAVLVLMFHSSSLMPGHSPYVPDAGALDLFLGRLADTCEYAISAKDAVPTTLSELAGSRHMGVKAQATV